MLICPKCNEILKKEVKRFICTQNHAYDISKTSHINLLKSSKTGDEIGDNKEMVRARTNFLSKDWYLPLAEKLCELTYKKQGCVYIDCGCGQGYYTKKISENLQNSICFATDISKNAVIHASKQDKITQYFVGSVFDLPIKNQSIDVLTSIFSPLATDEFYRILKPDGCAVIVVSGENHLFELKEKVYENPYKNDENKHNFGDFILKSKEKVTYITKIEENSDIKHLFHMTPYAFKTSKEDILKLEDLSNLNVTFDFAIYILEKKS